MALSSPEKGEQRSARQVVEGLAGAIDAETGVPMKATRVVAGVVLLLLAVIGGAFIHRSGSKREALLATQKDKLSYAVGIQLAQDTQRLGVELDPRILGLAAQDLLAGRKLAMTEQEVEQAVRTLLVELKGRRSQAAKDKAKRGPKEAEDFLAHNAKQEGVVSLPSGLQYKILKAGDGPIPTAADTVECNYRGTLLDGAEFDSSRSHSKPITFKVDKVIQGWREALTRMPAGSIWQLFVPPQLAYGERGAGRRVGPNATLQFEVELLRVVPADGAGQEAKDLAARSTAKAEKP
jgi:FKBP-type peptidyl-prolyl cis-trans isomerase FklB